jgi:hypothetical protein
VPAPKAAADPCGPPEAGDPAALAAAYEAVRAAALASPAGAGHGTALIRARGVAAWLQAGPCQPAAPASRPALARAGAPAPAVSVLAAMTLAVLAAP